MKATLCILFLSTLVACGPRKTADVHFLSLSETNQGRALPLHVIPVDDNLRSKLEAMSAEDWFLSEEAETLTGIKKKVLRGAQNELLRVERANSKNDFLVVVDFAEVKGSDRQKILIGDRYYSAKDIYVLVGKDSIRVVSKSVYNDYLKSSGH